MRRSIYMTHPGSCNVRRAVQILTCVGKKLGDYGLWGSIVPPESHRYIYDATLMSQISQCSNGYDKLDLS